MTAAESEPTEQETVSEDTAATEDTLSPDAMRAELKRARDDAAKYRQKAKVNADAAAKLEEIEQAKKSELERLTEDKEGLLHRAATAEDGLVRLRVALGAGIASDQIDEFASRLRGDTEDELRADASKLAAFFAPPAQPRRGDPSQAAGSTDTPVSTNPLQAALEDKLSLR